MTSQPTQIDQAAPEFNGHAPDDNHTSDGRCKYPLSCVAEGHLRERRHGGDVVAAHIERITDEAGLSDIMRAVLVVIRDRDEVSDDAFLALTPADVTDFYEGHVARAIDTVQNFIENP